MRRMTTATRTVPALGDVGIGWRREICGVIADLHPGFCEVIAESIPLGRRRARPDPALADLVARGVPVIPHGVALSLGGAEPVQPARVRRLAACAEVLDAPIVSEHIAFVRADGIEAGHLLPVPRTRAALAVLAANIERTRRELPVPLAVENIAAFLECHGAAAAGRHAAPAVAGGLRVTHIPSMLVHDQADYGFLCRISCISFQCM